jgi:hypothetical protein
MSMFELSTLSHLDRFAFFFLVNLQDRWAKRAEQRYWWNVDIPYEVEVWVEPEYLEYVTRGDRYLFGICLMRDEGFRCARIPSNLPRKSWIYRTILDDPDEACEDWTGRLAAGTVGRTTFPLHQQADTVVRTDPTP